MLGVCHIPPILYIIFINPSHKKIYNPFKPLLLSSQRRSLTSSDAMRECVRSADYIMVILQCWYGYIAMLVLGSALVCFLMRK